ncbi:kynu [Symbiodinium natans]|uniref:Kynureninase n=1 Tax=Symbiodinium natans TaxID=878477 RepID=A0A812TEW3_9DINO|nr:kynu [Symbiodinium natans]
MIVEAFSGTQAGLSALAAKNGIGAKSELQAAAQALGASVAAVEVADHLDKKLQDLASCQRKAFLVPSNRGLSGTDPALARPDEECVYLVGNSLGLQPARTRELVGEELDKWAKWGVNGHFTGDRPWMPIDENVIEQSAAIVGAEKSEVAVMNSLTVNLHLLFVSFYRPAGQRNRILYEASAFGSDYFAFESQARLHGLDPRNVLLPVKARPGEELLHTEDIVAAIHAAGDSLAVVCLGTVQYYTGQYFDVESITKAAHAVGAKAIWDCAHAVGNVDLKLHQWDVDGACWCNYKYLNAGPGAIGGFFVHKKHHDQGLPLLAGWWGQKQAVRFNMDHKWDPEVDAGAWRLSNPPVLQTVSLLASLEIFSRTTMSELRGRSMLLTAYLELLIADLVGKHLSVITPECPSSRGCQLSLKFQEESSCLATFAALEKRGIVVDHRKPNVIRVAPAPLYNSFNDVHKFCTALREALQEVAEPPAKRTKV